MLMQLLILNNEFWKAKLIVIDFFYNYWMDLWLWMCLYYLCDKTLKQINSTY